MDAFRDRGQGAEALDFHSLKTNKIAKFSMVVFASTESLQKPTIARWIKPVALQDRYRSFSRPVVPYGPSASILLRPVARRMRRVS